MRLDQAGHQRRAIAFDDLHVITRMRATWRDERSDAIAVDLDIGT